MLASMTLSTQVGESLCITVELVTHDFSLFKDEREEAVALGTTGDIKMLVQTGVTQVHFWHCLC